MKRFKRVMKKIGKGILVLIIVLAVVHSIASYILGRRLEAKIAEIKAQGEPVSTLDLGRNTGPDSENAAGIYLKIFEKMGIPIIYKNGVQHWKQNNKKRQWDSFFSLRIDNIPTPEIWKHTREFLANYEEIDTLTDKAVSMPYCKFTTNWKDGNNASFLYLSNMRMLIQYYQTSALVNSHYGKTDSAIRDAARILEISESLRNEPMMIGQPAHYRSIRNGLTCIRDISVNGFSESQIMTLEKPLSYGSLNAGYVTELKGERAMNIIAFSELISGRNVFLPDMGEKFPINIRWFFFIRRPFLYADMISYLDIISHYINDAKASVLYRKIFDSAIYTSRDKGLISGWWLPVLSTEMLSRDVCEAGILSCRTMLNLMKYKHRFGAYPGSLDELRSKLKVDVPVDPMSGKDFVYKRQKDGFLLYSIGANMRDDSGKSAASPHDTEPDDIAWSMTK